MKKPLPLKWIIGAGVVVIAALAFGNLKFGDSVVYFYTPDEAYAKASSLNDKTIKVGGMVKVGTVQWKPEELTLDFVMTDMKSTEINVHHKGVPPDMFKEGQGVVVEGRIDNDGKTLISRNLMVKHSEEYKTPDQHHSINKELLEKSIFKE